jgi:hypothetical protein
MYAHGGAELVDLIERTTPCVASTNRGPHRRS